ncbi:SAF domain-containing protein [Nocardioides insulae]|uniref:SAF domain-containing protein n=1 Tax=Nocardioides insulae TaxID=394734 RepID=UPI0004222709|nr:SAF domain-containing protein [Nocardioides insulae]
MTALHTSSTALRRLGRRIGRQLLIRRRLLAALFAVVAVAAGLQSVAPPAPATAPLTVAARDLPAGATLLAADLTTVAAAPDLVPDGTAPAGDLVGQTLAAPVRRGEAITDRRLVGGSFLTGRPDGLSALPVRITDPGAAGLVEAGQRIDLLATDPTSGRTRVVAPDALVLAVPPVEESADSVMEGTTGRLVIIGIPTEEVPTVAGASARLFLSVAFTH